MTKKRGRPRKYAHFITILDNQKIYSPSSIVAYGEKLGFFKGIHGQAKEVAKRRVRIAIGVMKRTQQFPIRGDGLVIKRGLAPTPGWYGARWKAALEK